MKIAIGCDHAGLQLKEAIKIELERLGHEASDVGTNTCDSVDYPDYGQMAAQMVSSGKANRGILICGTGIGMSIVANKYSGIRAALCNDVQTAVLSRQHNDSNILVLGARVTAQELALKMLHVWLDTPYEGGRHQRRLQKIKNIEDSVKDG
ncbi:ribose 5-phosphate isomerase B [Candidatus Magnetomonas plexicatena]|uniref:ribose 5-phosphate isomerase B n=1 Tax=Candidatus Magnetomonas plexicatena TaxID=2552947 RepID=UPI0011037E8A|nr:ribose 5-phosphate isomerase B [Nitrospirales bacterium LBB_01]